MLLRICRHHGAVHLPGSVRLALEDSHKLARVLHGLATNRAGTTPKGSPFKRIIAGDRDLLYIKVDSIGTNAFICSLLCSTAAAFTDRPLDIGPAA